MNPLRDGQFLYLVVTDAGEVLSAFIGQAQAQKVAESREGHSVKPTRFQVTVRQCTEVEEVSVSKRVRKLRHCQRPEGHSGGHQFAG